MAGIREAFTRVAWNSGSSPGGNIHTQENARGRMNLCMQRSISQQTPPRAASWLDKADDSARRHPTKAVAYAAGLGFFLNLLPIGAILGGLVAISFALLRPALLFLGLFKAFEFLRAKSTTQN
jgi:hypothetical protein